MDKFAIRKMHLEMRRAISKETKEEFSEKIANRVLGFLKSNPAIRHVHLFLPIQRLNEINTIPLFETMQDMGYVLYTSYLDPKTQDLGTLEISRTKEFEKDAFGIPIPKDIRFVGNDLIQLVLVPLLAFDTKGNRIGYGKAYYDLFLSKLNPEIIKVGLSFFPPLNEIPIESHDIGLDICITPDAIYHFKH
jgi:5-formyltetrahydrofolate cyclo-ligase